MIDECGRAVVRPGTGDDLPGAEPGKVLGRHHSTIAREIARNGGAAAYSTLAIQEHYESFKARPKERKLVASSWLHDALNERLRLTPNSQARLACLPTLFRSRGLH
jgi:IS30 family transposase